MKRTRADEWEFRVGTLGGLKWANTSTVRNPYILPTHMDTLTHTPTYTHTHTHTHIHTVRVRLLVL